MIYDNKYCLVQAEWLVKTYGDDQKELVKQISGELCRLHRIGQADALQAVKTAVREADQKMP